MKLKQLLRIPDRYRSYPDYNYTPYKSAEELKAIACRRMQDSRRGFFPPRFPGEFYAYPNAIRSSFAQYPPSSLKTSESIFNKLYCEEPFTSRPPNMKYLPSGNWSCNHYMKNFKQELVCTKPKAKHQKSDYHKPKKSDSDKPKAKPNNAFYYNRQRPRHSDKKSSRYHKQKLTPIDSVSVYKSKSTTSIESPASAKHRRSFESFSPVATIETNATQVSTETGNEKENYNAAAQLVPKVVITEATVKIDAIEVNNFLAAAENNAGIEIVDESVKEEAPKKAPKEANQVVTNVGTTKVESGKADSSSRGSSLTIAERIANLGAKMVQENVRSTKRSKSEIRVDVAKEIAKVERISEVAELELEPEPKVEIEDSKNSTDLLREIDSTMLVQAADEYAICVSECMKVNTKTPKDIEQTISEPTNNLNYKHVDAEARTQRFKTHRKRYFADREKRFASHKKHGLSLDALFTRSHGKYLGEVYGRQIEKIGIDRKFLAKKLQEECKSVQFLNRESTKSELEELREAILICHNQFYKGIHPQAIKDDISRILFRSPLASI